MADRTDRADVIVVNSHVVRGSVGGRASVFALQRLGIPVWSLPTVSLAWHPGHGPATRFDTPPDAFATLVDDLCRALRRPRHPGVGGVTSGYLGNAGQAGDIATLVTAAKTADPEARYLCDPVIGDTGGLYQPEAIATAIRDRLLPLADIATPNRFELGWLTGTAAEDNAGLVTAARSLGPAEVVVTSAFAGEGAIGTLLVTADATHLHTTAAVEGAPHGAGDLFAALYFGHRLEGREPADAMVAAATATEAMIALAVTRGDDEMPLAAGQDLLVSAGG
ncbi:PfkB family carbohydrate kinase [Bauldia sp.]|uniref:PfkB family carbohydrate kinase n=1 Tax=Bauldia sp. TaxID=2575872 RepID=UPI003BA968FB